MEEAAAAAAAAAAAIATDPGAVNPAGLAMDNAVINTGQQLAAGPTGYDLPPQSPVQIGGTLNAAQTQYLSQLTQQNSDNIKQYGTAQTYHAQSTTQQYPGGTTGGAPTSQSYPGGQQYGTSPNAYVNNAYVAPNGGYRAQGDAQSSQQPPRAKTQRARVPPPSKVRPGFDLCFQDIHLFIVFIVAQCSWIYQPIFVKLSVN